MSGGKAAKRTAGSAAMATFGLSQLRLLSLLWLHGRVAAEHGAGRRHQAHDVCPGLSTPHALLAQKALTTVRQLVLVFVRVCMGRLHLWVRLEHLFPPVYHQEAHGVGVHYWACLLTRCGLTPLIRNPLGSAGARECVCVFAHVGDSGKEPAQLQLCCFRTFATATLSQLSGLQTCQSASSSSATPRFLQVFADVAAKAVASPALGSIRH